MLMKDSSFVKRITDNTNRFRSQMTKAGFTISGDNHPISPGLFQNFIDFHLFDIYKREKIFASFHLKLYIHIFIVMLGDAKLASDFADDMLGNYFSHIYIYIYIYIYNRSVIK